MLLWVPRLLVHAIMPYWEVHFLINHVYGCVPAWRKNLYDDSQKPILYAHSWMGNFDKCFFLSVLSLRRRNIMRHFTLAWLRAHLRKSWAEPELILQCEQGSAQIFSVSLEFLIRAAGCSHYRLSSGSARNPSWALSIASVEYPIVFKMFHDPWFIALVKSLAHFINFLLPLPGGEG